MAGILYGIGIGPGDPELLTIKAVKCLRAVSCLAVPKAAGHRPSLALSIVQEYLTPQQEILELIFPMTADPEQLQAARDTAADETVKRLAAGAEVGFITLGDPSLYSTFTYLQQRVRERGFGTRVIPGITAMCAAAAQAGIPLAEEDEPLAILPATALNRPGLESLFTAGVNTVVMKPSANWEQLRDTLAAEGLLEKSVLVRRCGQPGETVQSGVEFAGTGDSPDYFTTIIIKQNGAG